METLKKKVMTLYRTEAMLVVFWHDVPSQPDFSMLFLEFLIVSVVVLLLLLLLLLMGGNEEGGPQLTMTRRLGFVTKMTCLPSPSLLRKVPSVT